MLLMQLGINKRFYQVLKLSIITVNLNNAIGLRKTIESVVNQIFTDYEYIIIDGGSSDSSIDVIKEFSGKITYWVSEPDKGIYNAMNKGIIQAKGEYIQFLNSGDWLVDETILSNVFKLPRTADIVYGHQNLIDDEGIKVHMAINENELSLVYFFGDSLGHSSTFIAKRLFRDCIYDESFVIAADKKFFIEKIISQNCTILKIDEIIANFNLKGISNDSKNKAKLREENTRIFTQIIPPRIAKDYKIILSVKNSTLLTYLPFLNSTYRFQKFIARIIGVLIKIYICFNPKKHFSTNLQSDDYSSYNL